MSFLRNKIDQIKKPFARGEKWEKFAPAVNAFDTFYLYQITPPTKELTSVMLSI